MSEEDVGDLENVLHRLEYLEQRCGEGRGIDVAASIDRIAGILRGHNNTRTEAKTLKLVEAIQGVFKYRKRRVEHICHCLVMPEKERPCEIHREERAAFEKLSAALDQQEGE